MAKPILPTRQEYKPGYLFANTGNIRTARDTLDAKIPQLHALLLVAAANDGDWCEQIQTELILLACGLSEEIHEALEADEIERTNRSNGFAS